HFRNLKSKSGTRIICLLVPLLLPKFVSEGAAMYHELRKRGTSLFTHFGGVSMTIPRAAYPAPFNTTRASHVVLSVKDLGASRAFYVDAMGFVISDESKDTLYLRGLEEACHHSVVLKQGAGEPACERIGLRGYPEDDREKAKA